jgi:seryl-tRNA synthetase
MLDIKWIRDNPNALAEALVKRGQSSEAAESTVADLIARDEARRAHLGELQLKQERRNAASKEIGNAMRAGDGALAERLKLEVQGIKEFIQSGEATERALDKALNDALAVVPNIPLPDVPVGKDEHDNVELRNWGKDLIAARQPRMGNKPKEHFEIGEALGMMDFERAAKLSGSRFTVLKGKLARLERALGQFMLDLHTGEHEYEEVQPPLLVRKEAMFGTGQLPKFEEDLFQIGDRSTVDALLEHEPVFPLILDNLQFLSLKLLPYLAANRSDPGVAILASQFQDLFEEASLEDFEYFSDFLGDFSERARDFGPSRYLIPTAEVPLTNLVREEILDAKTLPRRMTALTPCFRSEAGSAGRDTRGMLRQHQFNKVELVSITDADTSIDEHERMTACAEEVLKRLGLPFRTMLLCTGDMGFGSRKTYDIEVWLPGQNAYREISSCSVCGDFQARRMDARYRSADAKGTTFVHTLNGSGVAVGRALIAVMENYQNEDGSVTIPEVLRPYMGGMEKIERA